MKNIPVALLIAIGMQTAAFIWYLSALDATVKAQGVDLARLAVQVERTYAKVEQIGDRVQAIESERSVRRTEIDRRLDSLEGRRTR